MGNLERADARLKLVKICDDLAHVMERLHLAVQHADKADVAALVDGNPFTAPGHTNIVAAIQMSTREIMLWATHLHDDGKFEQLGTRRYPDEQHDTKRIDTRR